MTKPAVRSSPVLLLAVAIPWTFGLASCGGDESACTDGLTDCGGECADLSADPDHCGGCATACASGQICAEGTCTDFCGDGLAVCGDACVNLQINEQNCGGCGIACPPGVACSGGSCAIASCIEQGLVDCGGVCVDPASDPGHCGGCFHGCSPGQVCAGGTCQGGTCPPGLVDCGGGLCADIFNDPLHCGGCFIECGPGGFCAGGSCQGSCPPGLTDCGDGCVSLASDPQNCGFCFNGCGLDQICSGGVCQGCMGGVCGSCSGLVDLGSTSPQSVAGSNAGLADAHTPSCGPPGSGEVFFAFTAPSAGTYTFDTAGSGFDTVLSLLDPGCGELACNDDFAGTTSQLSVDLGPSQTVFVVVDGFGGSQGAFNLHVNGGGVVASCPEADLGSGAPQTVSGSTAGSGDSMTPSCAPPGSPEMAFLFTAPSTGSYAFDTQGSSFDTVLHVHDGSCAGPELACNDDVQGVSSLVNVSLVAGQTIVVAVDGFGGDQGSFTLHVTGSGGTCPLQILGDQLPVTVSGSTLGLSNAFTPGCVPAVGPEATFSWTAPFAGTFTFDTLGSSYDTVLSLRDGGCGGSEIACNDDAQGVSSKVTTSLAANQTIVVVVDGFGGGSYTLHIQ